MQVNQLTPGHLKPDMEDIADMICQCLRFREYQRTYLASMTSQCKQPTKIVAYKHPWTNALGQIRKVVAWLAYIHNILNESAIPNGLPQDFLYDTGRYLTELQGQALSVPD